MRNTQTTGRTSEVKKVQINVISNKQLTDRFTHVIFCHYIIVLQLHIL